jgi:uncharacterized membrane protein
MRGGVFVFGDRMMRALLLVLALAACSPQAEPTDPAKAPAPAAEEPVAPSAETAGATQASNLAQMPSWESAREAGVDFRAVGQEPGWLLDIYTRGIIKVVWAYGENYAAFAVVDPTHPREGVTRYEGSSDGRSLVVTIRRAPCQDAMSGEPYPSTVEVVIDQETLRGCGRSV